MIQIQPGKGFEFKNPNVDMRDLEEQVRSVLRAASPFLDTIRIFNKTKSCLVEFHFNDKQMTIVFTNPNDEIFDLNENGDAICT